MKSKSHRYFLPSHSPWGTQTSHRDSDWWVVVSHVGRGSRVTRVTGQLTDGSRGSWVIKCDPSLALPLRARISTEMALGSLTTFYDWNLHNAVFLYDILDGNTNFYKAFAIKPNVTSECRDYFTFKVGYAIKTTMKKRSERRKRCARAGCSKVRTPPARPLSQTHRQDRLQYTAPQLASA